MDVPIEEQKTLEAIEEFREGAEGGATAAGASSRNTVELSQKNTFCVYKTVLNSQNTKNIFHVYKTISGEKLLAFLAIGKRL